MPRSWIDLLLYFLALGFVVPLMLRFAELILTALVEVTW
jgi:hypothetical protein